MGSRELAMFHLTFGMNNHPNNPMERFLAAVRFFLGTVRSERFDKKPWNPVLGETHITYADVIYGEDGVGTTETIPTAAAPSGGKGSSATSAAASSNAASSTTSDAFGSSRSRTIFVGEQVSHHPPISAICLSNSREEIQCQANVSFTVKFGGNTVTVATAGGLQIISKRFNETYELTKCLPDMVVRNVVWGKKYIMWEGDVTMTCPQTGLTAFFKFKEKSSQNLVKGAIVQGDSDDAIIELHGVCGEKIMFHYADQPEQEFVLLDLTKEPSARIHYLPKSKLAPLSSVGVWEKVNKAIVDDDISLADKEKKVIEQAQRDRAKARIEAKQEYSGCYFDMTPEGIWSYKNNMELDTVLKVGAQSIDPVVDGSSDSSADEDGELFISQDENAEGGAVEPLLLSSDNGNVASGAPSPTAPRNRSKRRSVALGHTPTGSGGGSDVLSDADRSPITSGDELEDMDVDGASSAANLLEVPPKRRRGSSTGMRTKGSSSSLAASNTGLPSTKKELKAEKKKAREEVKMVMTKMKEEKKKGTAAAIVLDQQVHAGWAKVRNMMKQWKDRYIVLFPGRLVIFRSPGEAAKMSCVGLLNLNGCDVRPRPSKKDGSCFKIYSLNQYPIYSRQGLKGESISSAILPVGSDYCILRCSEASQMNLWIDKIRQCIPDWEKNKALIKAAGIEDSDSDDDSEDSDIDGPTSSANVDAALGSPAISQLALGGMIPSPSSPAIAAGSNPLAQISNEEILNQIGQLYKITRKMSQRHRKYMDAMDEFRTKQLPENFTDLKKQLASSASTSSSNLTASSSQFPHIAVRKNPLDKPKAEKPKGLAGKAREFFDPKTIVLVSIILIMFYLYLSK
jgi:hypothetical protein